MKTVTLHCEPGNHDWQRPAQRGRKPRACPEHMETEERHPDITDRFGRRWVWKDKTLYTHDDTLAFPEDMIDTLGLPSAKLADNPNYDKLCEICRSEWPGKPKTGPGKPKTVTLTCAFDGHEWERESQRGRKPAYCPGHSGSVSIAQVIDLDDERKKRRRAEQRIDNLEMMLRSRGTHISQQKDY